jgi:hypothetical protein
MKVMKAFSKRGEENNSEFCYYSLYSMVLLPPPQPSSSLLEGAARIWRTQKLCTFPFNACDFFSEG